MIWQSISLNHWYYKTLDYRKMNVENISKSGETLKKKENKMAKNKPYGDNRRIGSVKKRSQTHNPKLNRWIKRDTNTGKFLDQKSDSKPFKGIRKEK